LDLFAKKNITKDFSKVKKDKKGGNSGNNGLEVTFSLEGDGSCPSEEDQLSAGSQVIVQAGSSERDILSVTTECTSGVPVAGPGRRLQEVFTVNYVYIISTAGLTDEEIASITSMLEMIFDDGMTQCFTVIIEYCAVTGSLTVTQTVSDIPPPPECPTPGDFSNQVSFAPFGTPLNCLNDECFWNVDLNIQGCASGLACDPGTSP